MHQYELTCVFKADPEVFKSAVEAVKQELGKLEVEISKEDDMGQRNLAYPINKELQGHYYVYYFPMDPTHASELDRVLRLKPELLRYLLVRRDD